METLRGTETIPRRSDVHPIEPAEAKQNAHKAQLEARRRAEVNSTKTTKTSSGAIWPRPWTTLLRC